jgi:16S rRNA (guanine527-N7)-methyltransferase
MTEPSYESLLAGRADEAAVPRLARYAELVERWSQRHNLVRFGTRRELVERHILDALAGAELLPAGGRLVDVGSGAGLPGVPLLLARRDWRGDLVEPRHKRWAFLKLVIRELDLDAEALNARYQDLPGAKTWRCVVARAVGDYGRLLAWAADHLEGGGQVLLWATEEIESRLVPHGSWRVVSWPLPGLERGRLCRLRPCST